MQIPNRDKYVLSPVKEKRINIDMNVSLSVWYVQISLTRFSSRQTNQDD